MLTYDTGSGGNGTLGNHEDLGQAIRCRPLAMPYAYTLEVITVALGVLSNGL